MSHSHPKGNFVPKAVLMKSGLKTLSTARQNSSRAAIFVNTARPINTAYPKPTVNCAKPASNVFNRAHSHVRKPFNKFTTNRNNNFNKKVNTVKGNVTTARPKAVVSNNKGNEANAVKASACWIWIPKQKVLDHVSRHNGASMNFKRFDYIDAQGRSKHMTGNMSYLSDYEEINGGYVAFGGDPKGGKITGKGKIRTGKMDIEDVYFVKELKFNLFSVSQMCDKKNSVLFTDIECVVLSQDFKLTDESYVLLKVPRKDNMRLGHVNFKTINKLVKGNLARGLPSKPFEINQTCVACQKGKQYKASCRKPALSFMRPFGCPVTILNTIDHLGSGPKWLFDIDVLTKSMNYEPVVAGNQSNGNAVPSFSSSLMDSPDAGFKPSGEEEKKDAKALENKDIKVPNTGEPRVNQECDDDLNMPNLEKIVYLDDDEEVGAEADLTNLDIHIPVSPIPTAKIHKDHPLEQIIRDIHSAPQTRRMTKNVTYYGMFSSVQQRINHKDF
ncbi:ribonuclease H-like domain-containing protein [Tanacetum coccineum]